jgi:DNA repair protein RAD51
MMQLQKISPSLLDKIKVNRITNTGQQIQRLSKIRMNSDLLDYSLIIIDSITDLFSFEYSKKEQSLEKHISFMKYMHSLSSIAINRKIPIIVTNIVRTINKHEKENLEESISMYTHTKIKLSKGHNGYFCQAISPFDNKKFQYTITSRGITDQS